MAPSGSVSHWLGQLKAGDQAAAQPLWERYFERLLALARAKLQSAPRGMADEEDVALSAFDSFCRGAERGRFPKLADRGDLWQLLVVVTVRKAIDLRQHEGRQKRGGAWNEDASLPALLASTDGLVLEQVLGREPTPAFAAQVAEECQHLLGALRDADLEAVAKWKMEGYTNEEIADKLGCVPRTVERKLRLIRSIWTKETSRDDL